ncbi:MAG: ABC transporter ATP-binding protein [Erysipelotrichaceae bacterium]|nr:ABC transporter ATP-binding protein [Erysipelotrichaceae bacterium]
MKRLSIYLKKYSKESILAPFFKLLEALMDLMVPLVVARIINQGIALNDTGVIIRCFIFLIALAVLGMCFSFTAQFFAAKASVGFACDVRQTLFDHIGSFSYSQMDHMGLDTLITRLTSDINQMQTGLNLSLRLLLRSPFIVFGAMIMAFTIDSQIAMIFVIAIIVLCIVVFGIMLTSIPLFEKAQVALDKLLSILREDLTGVRVIRAFRKEEDEITQFDLKNEILKKINLTVSRLSALMNPLTYVIVNIATIYLISKGAVKVDQGVIAQGDVVALYNYMAQIIIELIKLASLIITINKSLACSGRVSQILAIEADMKYKKDIVQSNDSEYAVVFDDVSFAYNQSGEAAVKDISFEAKKGQTIGIIGGTGSGKSTIINLIPRFYDADEGSVLINGIDVKDYPKGSLTDLIGIVPQKAVLFEGSIRDNLKWGNENASDDEIFEALKIAQALEVVERKEKKLDEHVEQNGRNFSGGQRQRLTIARALVKKPEILILDDSASALDLATDLNLRKAIAALKDMTVFIVSQRSSSVRNCDLILVMDDGELKGKGTHEELMKDCKVYQEIYYSQYPEEAKKGGLSYE